VEDIVKLALGLLAKMPRVFEGGKTFLPSANFLDVQFVELATCRTVFF
jgi:hypothetical protein